MIKKALHYLLALCLFAPGIAAFGQASTNSTITGVGVGGASSFNAAAPGPIGGTTPAAGTFTSLTDTGLTSTRIPFSGTGGLLGDSANLTFASNVLGTVDGVGTFGASANRWSSAFLGSGTAITASTPALDIAQTWNNAGVTFTGSQIAITSTASAAASLVASWTVGGSNVFKVDKNGSLTVGGTVNGGGGENRFSSEVSLRGDGGAGTSGFFLSNLGTLGWSVNGNGIVAGIDTNITRSAAGILQIGTGATANSSGTLKLTTLNSVGAVQAFSATAIPAGGTAGSGLLVSSTANFGVFFGSGAPSLSAAKGSLYLRSDGSGVADRIYVNTNGSTTWTNLVSGA